MRGGPLGRLSTRAALGILLISGVGACTPSAPPVDQAGDLGPMAQPYALPAHAGHVHALAKDPASGRLLLATHAGLFVEGPDAFDRVGPAIDLMGFTVAGAGHYYASGHPQPGADLPNPLGVVETVDGGRTWQVLSRAGVSDFHSMAVSGSGLVGFDGAMLRTDDGRTWQESLADFEPISLAGRADDHRVVASTQDTVMISKDSGRTWSPVPGSPAPALVSRADNAVIAVTGDGQVHLADASGGAWTSTDLVIPRPLAVLASGPTGQLEIVVLTESGLVVSRGGRAFVPWSPT